MVYAVVSFYFVYSAIFLKLLIISIFCLRVVMWISISIYFFFSWASIRDSVVAAWGSILLRSCFNLRVYIIFTFRFNGIFQFLSYRQSRTLPALSWSFFGVIKSMFFSFPPPASQSTELLWGYHRISSWIASGGPRSFWPDWPNYLSLSCLNKLMVVLVETMDLSPSVLANCLAVSS